MGPRPTSRSSGLVAAGVIALVALAVVLVVALLMSWNPFGDETVDRSGSAVLERMRQLEEFTAAEATFTQDVDIEQDARFLPGFLKGQRVVALVTGTVRGVVDFSGMDEDSVTVDDDGRAIRVVLPDPTLSDVDIDESSARIVARNRGLIDRVQDAFAANPGDDAPLYRLAEEKVAAEAQQSELIEEARTNTERWLRTFLGAAGFETVEVSWTSPPV
jgi:hypothetical protein